MSKRLLGGIIGCKYKTSSWHLNRFLYMVATLSQQYNIEKKPTFILYTYIINRHAGTPEKQRRQNSTLSNMVVIIYCYTRFFFCLKKNQSTPRPSEHPPVMGEKGSFFGLATNTLNVRNNNLYLQPIMIRIKRSDIFSPRDAQKV